LVCGGISKGFDSFFRWFRWTVAILRRYFNFGSNSFLSYHYFSGFAENISKFTLLTLTNYKSDFPHSPGFATLHFKKYEMSFAEFICSASMVFDYFRESDGRLSLPPKAIIYTVGPILNDDGKQNPKHLADCYSLWVLWISSECESVRDSQTVDSGDFERDWLKKSKKASCWR
jgi:hypothetical protein